MHCRFQQHSGVAPPAWWLQQSMKGRPCPCCTAASSARFLEEPQAELLFQVPQFVCIIAVFLRQEGCQALAAGLPRLVGKLQAAGEEGPRSGRAPDLEVKRTLHVPAQDAQCSHAHGQWLPCPTTYAEMPREIATHLLALLSRQAAQQGADDLGGAACPHKERVLPLMQERSTR